MSSHKFELLDEEVEAALDQVTDKLQFGVPQCKSQEERKALLSEIQTLLKDAGDSLLEMNIEVRKAPEDYKTTMNSKIHRYQNELTRHQRQVDQEQSTLSHMSGRLPLFSNAESNSFDAAIRKQVQHGTAILERTSASIARSTVIAVETEQVGTEVLGELGTQRETITRTRDRLVDADGEISRSKRIIRSISRNVVYNKILLIVIILLECAILGALIYWKFFMK
ncbi:vesicle transport through interaction with t-SNAREs homolog 1B-like [Eriocheir sinensis]|uniref:vesicle transport through interaction with t-SNAREs homolog 1B-like n=1 Tax=Eriocheir sinensis TaxID=95602 RepID=UPI0021C79217|nr:vesicle transport through interaction with t-SNAREs homolog 1B-like [Eriocheir sinensis]XP_050713246.1 vesicle transport through interaction with t-SNAREs homolog 1B-like [Eriocheir sinensis]XP_050713247.1 vesicle transport through interaction with t-SNAREs homolog 1B-like [Eriocheir sinensis]XP_050713248.1 vesicle transport through interaction with t-SNAREs homolog 1B-like [Eriocheir sinensis]